MKNLILIFLFISVLSLHAKTIARKKEIIIYKNPIIEYWKLADLLKQENPKNQDKVQQFVEECYSLTLTKMTQIYTVEDKGAILANKAEASQYYDVRRDSSDLFYIDASYCLNEKIKTFLPSNNNPEVTNSSSSNENSSFAIIAKSIKQAAIVYKPFSQMNKWVIGFVYGEPILLKNAMSVLEMTEEKINTTYLFCEYEGNTLSDWGKDESGSSLKLLGRWARDDQGNGFFATLTSPADVLKACKISLSKLSKDPIDVNKIKSKAGSLTYFSMYPLVHMILNQTGYMTRLN